ncbi:Peripheral-type benzodiazepine receptor-associated protein 1 [Nymphon striatum]|nr:Peripheral-type benzodiazepine receptor-associated protein 1 [Nymphon striatum]
MDKNKNWHEMKIIRHVLVIESLQKTSEINVTKYIVLEETNQALRQRLQDLDRYLQDRKIVEKELSKKAEECIFVQKKLKERTDLCSDLENQLSKALDKNTQLVINNCDLQSQYHHIETLEKECQELNEKLAKTANNTSKSEATTSNSKLANNLETVVRNLREAGEKRKELEKEHAEALAHLRTRQEEAKKPRRPGERDRDKCGETIESLESKVRELQKKCEIQYNCHEELMLEMTALRRQQAKQSWSSSQQSSLTDGLTSPESNISTPPEAVSSKSMSNGDSGMVQSYNSGTQSDSNMFTGFSMITDGPDFTSSVYENRFKAFDDHAGNTGVGFTLKPSRSMNELDFTSLSLQAERNSNKRTHNTLNNRTRPNVKYPYVNPELDQLMAKLEQDNRVLAELDKTRASIAMSTTLSSHHLPNAISTAPFVPNHHPMGSSYRSTEQLLLDSNRNLTDHTTRNILRYTHLDGNNLILDESAEYIDIPGKGVVQVFVAKYTYDPLIHSPNENPEAELTVAAGEYIVVHGDMDEDGFYNGELLDGRNGLVPSNFVVKLIGEDLYDFQTQVIYGSTKDSDDSGASFSQELDFLDDNQLSLEDYKRMNDYIDLEDIEEVDEDNLSELEGSDILIPPPNAPQRLTLQKQLSKSILIAWLPPDGSSDGIESYQIYVDGILKGTVKSQENTRALLEGVDSTRVYSPLAPAYVKGTNITSTSAVISWLPSNSNFQHVICVNSVEVRTVKPGIFRHTITGYGRGDRKNMVKSDHKRLSIPISKEVTTLLFSRSKINSKSGPLTRVKFDSCFGVNVTPLFTLTRVKLTPKVEHVDDIDLFVGGLLEPHIGGAEVGGCIIGEQFRMLVKGDRFFYANGKRAPKSARQAKSVDTTKVGHAFTKAQYKQFQKASLAQIICDNINIKKIQPHAMLAEGKGKFTILLLALFCFHELDGFELTEDYIAAGIKYASSAQEERESIEKELLEVVPVHDSPEDREQLLAGTSERIRKDEKNAEFILNFMKGVCLEKQCSAEDLSEFSKLSIPDNLNGNCVKRISCDATSQKYRTINGTCNNLKRPIEGSSNTAQGRLLDPFYDDGITAPRRHSKLGGLLHSPRHISNIVMTDEQHLTTSKTSLLTYFGQIISHDYSITPMITVVNTVLYDAMFIIQSLPTSLPHNFGKVAELVLKIICSTQADETHFVCDSYVKSIKNAEQQARGANDGSFNITGADQLRPKDFRYALRSPNFKTALIKFFMEEWKRNKYAAIIKRKTVVVAHENQCIQYTATQTGNVEHNEVPDYICSHVEADTTLVYHLSIASEASPGQNVVVRATDTDIMVILLYHARQLNANVWMDLGHSADNTRKYAHINTLANHIGPVLCKALPGYHALTGCDYTSSFFRKGKVNPLKKAEKSSLHLEGLSRLEENITFVDDDDLVERYVCSLYGHGTLSSVNAARLKMFLQKYKPTNHDSPLEQIKGIDAGMLPPCKDVLVQKLARCNYVAYLWKHANLRDPLENIQPTDYGWKEVNGIFLPVWFTGSQMPTILAETIAPEDVADGVEDGEDNDSINDADSDDNDDSDDEDEND